MVCWGKVYRGRKDDLGLVGGGPGVSRCTCFLAAFPASCMYVYVTCACMKYVGLLSPGVCLYVLVSASWAASMSAGGGPVSQLVEHY